MNYRHAYHAGNFADCFKHALLVVLVESLTRKPMPFFVLDTHAGSGQYNLSSEEAVRTGEADTGILALRQRRPPQLRRYLDLVERLGLYPGSPRLIRELLRPGDRLACCELHIEDTSFLRTIFRGDQQVTIHQRSGWEALGALLPPMEKRGLTFIDAPFESADEFQILADALGRAHDRFAHGIFAAWFPVKALSRTRSFMANIQSRRIRDVVAVELHIREPLDPTRLNGCGLLVINPPFRFEERADEIVRAVLHGLGRPAPGAGSAVCRIADE